MSKILFPLQNQSFFSFFVHWFKPGYIEFYVILFLSTSVSYLKTWRGGNHCCLWEHSQGKETEVFLNLYPQP